MWRNVGLRSQGFSNIYFSLPSSIVLNQPHFTQSLVSRAQIQPWRTFLTLENHKPNQIRHHCRFLSPKFNHSRIHSHILQIRFLTSSPNEPSPQKKVEKKNPNPNSSTPQSHTTPILERLTHIHPPTKEELLAAATGFWSRFKIRFKWFSIRSDRPFNIDDINGFISWIFIGHVIWIILGTTTFFSLAILTVNTVFAQETLAKWVGESLTRSSGLQVVFEEAIVPKWKNGVISFSNVYVSKRPGSGKSKVIKGTPAEAAQIVGSSAKAQLDSDDGNYTQFDVIIDSVNVTLSFAKWFNGKGILKDVEMQGIRGVIDRTHVQEGAVYLDPKSYRREHNTGDFELDSFKMENLLLTVHQPGGFRPFNISIYACELPRLRQQWLFYDFLSANTISGSIDNSLFTLHPRQSIAREQDSGKWKKESRLRIDGLNFDHLNRGLDGPFSWIREGNVDIVADIRFPTDNNGDLAKVLSDVFDRVEQSVNLHTNSKQSQISLEHSEASQPSHTELQPLQDPHANSDGDGYLLMDLRIYLNDVRAAVPLFTKDISYVNNALIRPIVAYMNSRHAFIPVNCRIVKPHNEFDGAWTAWDSGMLEDVNREVYTAFERDILDDASARRRRIKKVGIWTIQLAAQALFIGMAGNFA